MSDNKSVHLRYFAALRERSGKNEEELNTAAETVGDLYTDLSAIYSFALPIQIVRASINGNFVPMSQVICDGDEVVFIPPVAGG